MLAFPNPANDYVTIGNLSGKGILTMFDIFGRPVVKHQVTSVEEKIFVRHLHQDTYVVQVTEGDDIVRTIQVIVE